MSIRDVAIVGTGLTDMSRRDLSPEAMCHQAISEALAGADLEPDQVGLVLVSNALGGRLCNQGNIRGQSWLAKSRLADVPIVNVDNSCGGGASALHLGLMSAQASGRPVLVLGVEKMWTGDRCATLTGIEDGLPADYRVELRANLDRANNRGGSILMGLNASWARMILDSGRATVEQIAAVSVKSRHHGALNPAAQHQSEVTLEEVLGSCRISGPLTRLMCSSFTDGAAALVLFDTSQPAARVDVPAWAPRFIGSLARSGNGDTEYHDRLSEVGAAAWEEFGLDPREVDLVELHDATSAEELFALESLGFFAPGEAGPATLRGETAVATPGIAVNPSGGLVARGHPLGATGLAQVVELATQLSGRAGDRQVASPRIGVAANTGGIIHGDAAFIGIHALRAGS